MYYVDLLLFAVPILLTGCLAAFIAAFIAGATLVSSWFMTVGFAQLVGLVRPGTVRNHWMRLKLSLR